MTFKEKLAKEHPENIIPYCDGGCVGCPKSYGYEENLYCGDGREYASEAKCTECWDREITTENLAELEHDFNIATQGHSKGYSNGYEKGLQDAWELARKIFTTECSILQKVFGHSDEGQIIMTNEPQEALAKLEAYEKEQEIKVGDVVKEKNNEREYVVIATSEETFNGQPILRALIHPYQVKASSDADLIKTGKHIDIESLLGQIRG